MRWLTLEQRTWHVTSEKERPLSRVFLAQVDGVIMGSVVSFGITNRCAYCKGTGTQKVGTVKRRCIHCEGKGYTEPTDTCMHICGCERVIDKGLVFICMQCFSGECPVSQDARDTDITVRAIT
jgi:hypothetical protein